MLYYKYKDGSGYVACQEEPIDSSLLINIPKQEYDEYMASIEPTEDEIRAEKEAELERLLNELYPDAKQKETRLVSMLSRIYKEGE